MAADKWFRSLALVAVLASWTAAASGQDATQLGVVVRLFNHAGVAGDMLDRAREDIVRIYREIGVPIVWLATSSDRLDGQFTIDIIVRPDPVGISTRSRVMGATLGDAHELGGTAFVFKDRVLQTAHKREQDMAQVLAYAIAHEMGHVLLPAPAHSDVGIMRAEWNGDDLRHVATDSLRFTPEQALLIRSKVAGAKTGS